MQIKDIGIIKIAEMRPKYKVTPKKAGCMRKNWITVVISIMIVTIRLALLFRT